MGDKAKSSRKDNKYNTKLISVSAGALASTVIFFVLLALFAFFSLKSGFSDSIYFPAGLVTGALSGFTGGFICVRPIKEKGVLFGFVSGLIQALICCGILFAINGASAGNGLFILFGVITVFSAFGGIAAVNLKIKKKY